MYSIESKKRKFDRVLESINNPTLPQSPSAEDLSKSLQKRDVPASSVSLPAPEPKKKFRLSDEVAKKRLHDKASTSSLRPEPNYLPHSQTAFLARLSTFSSIQNWRVASSEKINAVEWAKRGWSCVGRERVACRGGCEAEMLVNIDEEPTISNDDPSDDDDTAATIEENHRLLVEKYSELITTGHLSHCLWRKRGCDVAIQRLPLLNAQSSLRDLQTRYDDILEMSAELPTNIRLNPDTDRPELSDLDNVGSDSKVFRNRSDKPWTGRNRSAFLLALAGWEPAMHVSDADVVECRSCFRRLGLWLYRAKSSQEEPTMEHLDVVDSHLDFCPWKSGEAQQTQVDIDGQKKSLAGWQLLVRNVNQEKARIATGRQPGASGLHGRRQSISTLNEDDATSLASHDTADEREKRSKALMRKIRELKRPFNVKALLRRKDTSKG